MSPRQCHPSFPPPPNLVIRYRQRRAFRCSRFPRNTYERLRLVILRRDFSSNQGAASERSGLRERTATLSWRKRSRIWDIQRASACPNRPPLSILPIEVGSWHKTAASTTHPRTTLKTIVIIWISENRSGDRVDIARYFVSLKPRRKAHTSRLNCQCPL